MSNLKKLVWVEQPESFIDGQMVLSAQGAGITYRMMQTQHSIAITWHNQVKGTTGANNSYKNFNDAQAFVSNTHYPHFMSEFVKPDSITDIANWFKAAKPEPTSKDITTQIGCHYEEISEMDVALDGETDDNEYLAKFYKSCSVGMSDHELYDVDKKELLDSLCDQIVTAVGVAYMMGFDIEGALKEVIRSNNSKFENGKPIFNEQGKIMKGKDYSKPDLTPFIK